MNKKILADDDYYNEEKLVQNQHHDAEVVISDAEEVPSVYTPTPRNKKSSVVNNNQNFSNQNTLKPLGSEESSKNRIMNNSQSSQSSQDTQKDDEPQYPTRGQLGDGVMNSRNVAINRGNIESSSGKLSGGERGSRGGSAERPNPPPGRTNTRVNDNDSDANHDSDSEGNDSGDDSQQEQVNDLPGGYDPAAFRDLPVGPEIKEIFKFIERYQPQTIELEFKLKPFIPEYIPCIGDIDAFIKIPRPDGKQDNLGFNVLDEPSSRQSDPHVLDLQLRALTKQSTTSAKPTVVKSIEHANGKAIDTWIKSISDLQKNKPVQIVNYQRAMPDIESLMQQWPPEFEDLLKETNLPSADLNVDLPVYVNLMCALLDIPVYKSKIQSLHVLFSLYSEFKNSGHFNQNQNTQNPFATTEKSKNADQLIIE